MKCVLSGIEIPTGKYSIEHYCPKSRMPVNLAQSPDNKFYAIKVFNHIKGNLFPCEWEERKYDLIYDAYCNWGIKREDKKLLRQALNGMPKINPCELCICCIFPEFCIKQRTR